MSETDVKRATSGSTKYGAGAERRKHLSPEDKIKAVMKEFEQGTLHSGDGKLVTDRKQAAAIAYSEAGQSKNTESVNKYL